MITPWLQREALIAVKAYPNPSAHHHETVCVAAITREEGWIRLYPVQFRDLPISQQFAKYQRIELRMKKHDRDPRPESYRPDQDSIKPLDILDSKNRWAKRWAWVEPTLSPSMCDIQEAQKSTGKSLGVFRPKQVTDLLIEEDDADWSGRKQAVLDQLTFFDAKTQKLEKIPFIFKYRYLCDNSKCKGHTQSILDWEIMELYRNVRDGGGSPDEIKKKIREKFFDELCGPDKDTHFFVGNHSLHHNTFMVLGIFWPPKPPTTLFNTQ